MRPGYEHTVAKPSQLGRWHNHIVCPPEQLVYRELLAAVVGKAWLEYGHADPLDVVQVCQFVKRAQTVQTHLAVVFGVNVDALAVLQVHHLYEVVSDDHKVSGAKALCHPTAEVKLSLNVEHRVFATLTRLFDPLDGVVD